MVGESPGHEEDEIGRCFVGRTGRELDGFYLPTAGLRRHEVRVTNLIPVHPVANVDPTRDQVKFFEPYLLQEIKSTNPEFIVPMGAFAAKYFLGYQTDLHTVHGLPHTSSRFPDVTILPTYHPAAGLHNTETQALIVYDFEQIHRALIGTLPPRAVDLYPSPVYIELTDANEVSDALLDCERLYTDGADVVMGKDTEGYAGTPWGLSFSVDDGIAYVIRKGNTAALRAFGAWMSAHPNVLVILHNALHDLPILREMGIPTFRFEDTMIYAHCLCLEPQGLKDLAYRRCGMKMKSYDDVTGPAMRRLTGEYLVKVASGDWGLDPMVPERESDQEIKYRQPTALHKRALRAINDIYGRFTGTIIGPKHGGSTILDEMGVVVGKVDHGTVEKMELRKEIVILGKKPSKKTGQIENKVKTEQTFNAWFAEVPITVMPELDKHYGDFLWELKNPVPPEDPADPVKRWKTMQDDLEESVARCEASIGALPIVGLDAIEDQQIAINYSARDAHATKLIRKSLRDQIEAAGLLELAELDMAVLPYIDCMKTTGIAIDRKHMLDYGEQLKIEMRQIQEKLQKDLGIWFNPMSSKQTALIIYDMLGFPVESRTKEGQPSTNDKVLEAMAPLHPNIADITDYRELSKLRGTYALKLPRWMSQDGRLHPNWKVTRVPSGRLACSDPNLMAIPIRSARGNMIRRGFIPRPGYVFVGIDLSQIEMRVLAHLAQDKNLRSIFLTDKDFHSATAAFMWNATLEEIKAESDGKPYNGIPPNMEKSGGASRRASGKNVSFGIVYGVTAKGLQAQVKSKTHEDWSEERCQQMIDMWLRDAYPLVQTYMDRQKDIARQYGYVRTIMGRRRYLPGVHSTVPRIREEAFRQAINHPVQGSATEVVKLAEKAIWWDVLPWLWESGMDVKPILQVHDELIFETPTGSARELAEIVVDKMTSVMQLSVPVKADYHVSKDGADGGSWADLK